MATRTSEEEGVPEEIPQGDQIPIGGEGNEVPAVPPDMTKGEIREDILTLTRAFTTHVTRYIGPRMNALENTMTSRLRDFVKMNPPTFLVSKYTQWKDNWTAESGPIEWEEIKEAFLGNYFPHEMREVKVEEFINLRQENTSMEEYSLKFTMLYRCAQSLLSNPMDERSRLLIDVVDLVKEVSNHDRPSALKVKGEGCSSSQGVKPTCSTCENKHFGKCLVGTRNFFSCGKDDHKVRDCPNIASRGTETKEANPSALEGGAPKRNHFYALRA
ncbi:hypothetical protein EJD97_012851 [Solanum chilense]|uniref:Retrotransposon gag domain-containing protein n=1 Tax=Solanum chilense TaxID=4083 RepID=A0A6N2C9X5_SOLCI|nr:hypothetical protein EJD97_012851 [Solanum chilense]